MTRLLATSIATTTLSAVVVALATAGSARAASYLGTADYYAILAGSTITNTGSSVINGDLGLSPGTAVTGFPPGLVNGTQNIANAPAVQAQVDLFKAYNYLWSLSATANLSGQDLGGMTLTAGVYSYDTSAQLTGTLTLDGQGNPNSVFIIRVGSSFTTASNSSIRLVNGAQSGNVYFVVGSSATLGTNTVFNGKILALTSITLNTGATITCGAALAHNGAVTLDSNNITVCALVTTTETVSTVVGGDTTTGGGGTVPTNTSQVATALDEYVALHGSLPPAFQQLVDFLSKDELAAALDQLAGETATGVAPTGIQAMDSFMSQMFDAAFSDDQGAPQPAPDQPPRTVKALGYADEKQPTAVDAAFAALSVNPARRSVWVAGYGSRGTTAGDGSVGTTDRFASAFGFAAGYDYGAAPDIKVGVAFGVGRTNYNIADGLGGGSGDMLHAAVYGKKNFGAAYLAGAVAYAFNSVMTNRTAPLATTDSFEASFNAHDFAAQVETGIHYGWFTPYTAVRAQAFYTPAYREKSSTGAGADFALAYEDRTTYSARTELGARLAKKIALRNGKTLGLHGRVAWAHDFSSAPSVVASFQSMPDTFFTITGAGEASDSVLVSAGADIIFINGLTVGGAFDGAFAAGVQRYGGKGRVRLVW